MIDQSQAAYAPLPIEFHGRSRNRLSRCSTRASPYPVEVTRSVRSIRTRAPAESVEQALALLPPSYVPASRRSHMVQESPMVSRMAPKFVNTASPAPLAPVDANSQAAVATEEKPAKRTLRARMGSSARLSVLGWGKKKDSGDAPPTPATAAGGKTTRAGAPTPAKENEGHGMLNKYVLSFSRQPQILTGNYSNQTLRINRPRPKGRSMASKSHLSLRV